VRLAADANVLLSAIIGGRARVVLTHPGVAEILTTAPTLAKVQEYLSHLAKKKRLSLDTVLLAAVSLPMMVLDRSAYASKITKATRRLGRRDPEDVELLALAIHAGVPVWSNDNDFEDAGIEWFTTAEILKELHRRRRECKRSDTHEIVRVKPRSARAAVDAITSRSRRFRSFRRPDDVRGRADRRSERSWAR
jgi:predicted nucleic acid-binding protein